MYKDIIRKLSNKDLKLIRESKHSNYIILPKLSKDGRILPSYWKTFQVLQREFLGYIKGTDVEGEFQLNESGKQVAKLLNEKQEKTKISQENVKEKGIEVPADGIVRKFNLK